MSLRIGFDVDGVLADMDGELARQAEQLFGSAPPAENDSCERRLTARQQNRLWRHVQSLDNFWETLEELEPGVLSRLAAIAADQRWEIIFLTKRPVTTGATAQVQTQRWLEAQGFALPSVFVVQGSRGLIAAALNLDVVVDDRLENCMDVIADSKARAILVWREEVRRPPAETTHLGIGVVRSAARCLDILLELDAASAEQPGTMERLMRLLGLREPAVD